MTALAARAPVRFRGVGGLEMTAAGLTSRFEMADLTVMGLTEVLPRLPLLVRRIRETADDVVAWRPDALVTIDSPDFTLRVAARARKALPGLKVVHYVAPSVWAWRPGRAAKMARHVDHVLALLPFEPPYMHAAGMGCDFVGHPVAGRAVPVADAVTVFRARHGLADGQRTLLMAPGSRRGEVRRLLPDFKLVVERLRHTHRDLAVVVPVAETVDRDVRAAMAGLAPPVVLLPAAAGEGEKHLAFAAADAALCASGTVVLELAAAGTPMVTAYRTTWLTAQIVRRVVRVNTANLINLISGEGIVPEFLQEFVNPNSLTAAVDALLSDPDAGARQVAAFADVMRQLGRGGAPPAERAARSVLRFLADGKVLPDTASAAALPPGPHTAHEGKGGVPGAGAGSNAL